MSGWKASILMGGGGATLAAVTAILTLQADSMTLVERYGLLGLHAVVVLGIGSFICKIGWEQVKTLRGISGHMRSLADRQTEARAEHKEILEGIRDLHRRK
jgi:hypothetical protein